MTRNNLIREKLDKGQPSLSTRVMINCPSVVEALGHTGTTDYVEFLAEYTPFDLSDLDNFCRTTELYQMGSMIKIEPGIVPATAQRAIGSGFNGILFCDCRNAQDVKNNIRLVKPDHPDFGGLHGAITRRNAFMSQSGSDDYINNMNSVVLAFMIEKKDAVDNLDEILAVPGVDMIQWGPADYCMSIGKRRTANDPELQAVEKKVFTTAISNGIPARAEIETADQANKYLDMGVRHFSLGIDLRILHSFCKSEGEKILKAMEEH